MSDWRRRDVLAALGSGVVAGIGGCSGLAQSRVRTLVAGSMQAAASGTLQRETTAELAVESHGSVHAARLVADGKRDPGILALADPALFERLLETPWHAVVAGNELVLSYNPKTDGGQRVADAQTWTAPLTEDGVSFGRTDPDLDPLGYRTVFALELAARRRDEPTLAEDVLEPDQRYPETQLLAQFETGSVDAAVVYRSMAVERDYPFRELPPAVNLGDPAFADEYASVRYELPDGTVARGSPIEYAATRRTDDDATTAVFETMLAGSWLSEHGFTVRDQYPRMEGDVPNGLRG
ncbi:substrate-binding domain-containing protein [Halomicroarcula limicola]|uniref:Substrate-binding domain-containing protein n=1 Tax=Haloarcula limicola TaxID=1429915 RepID=A0A8J8C615_9EURY|nr:extracellular solute-binding protein [Halomicroarcula limicola]MBV0923398.1 substrate-binding domain-containing protein [Halomicroarcula limicola]